MTSSGTKLRLLITADAVGGVWQYCVDLLKSLRSRDIEVLLATLGPRPSEAQKLQLAGLANVTLVESSYPLEWMPGANSDLDASGRWLLSLQQQFRADVIHLNGYSHAALPWDAPALVVAHSCVYSWWRAVHGKAPPRDSTDWLQYRANVARGLEAATAVVSPSCDMAANLQREYRIKGSKTAVIHNGSRVGASRSARRRPRCVAAGRIWDAAKNLPMLDQIASQAKWPIQIAGDKSGPLHSSQQLRHVELLGVMPHRSLLRTLRTAGIFLHPALYEPFGLTVLEAARSGCCLVLADIPSLRELWEGHAQFVDVRDPERWVYELNGLIDDRVRRESLASSAQAHSLRYSTDRFVDAYLSLYKKLAGQTQERMADGAAA